MTPLTIVDAPSSAGAYAPGQEKAPMAMREAGFHERLRAAVSDYDEITDIETFRWRPDRQRPNAMNAQAVIHTASRVASSVASAASEGRFAVVLGGDCTVGIGTVAGLAQVERRLGLIYADYDTDLQTPDTTDDGALDWMGVAHMLDLANSDDALAALGSRRPLLRPSDVLLFGAGNITPAEHERIRSLQLRTIGSERVAQNPEAAAREALDWALGFDALVLHFDVDLIDFEDFPLSENLRRKQALTFDAAMTALGLLLSAPKLAALTVTEVNPDHDPGGNLERFCECLTDDMMRGRGWGLAASA
ncbi:arginase family protein [Roseibacterium beibuensis]|nr:arginase family protein [Roseibacterium beibuensis]MCS6626856.1 arginase family protein [Roseibacterium beibuensis]